MQTRVYRWRPPTWRPERDAIEVGTIRTTSVPLSSIPSMTVDHHGQGAGLRYRFEIVHGLLTTQARDRSRPGSRAPSVPANPTRGPCPDRGGSPTRYAPTAT